MAFGSLVGGLASAFASDEQADAAEDANRRAAQLERDQFDYSKDIQEALLKQQEPRRQGSQRAMRSLSTMLGLGDPGPSASISQQRELESLKEQLKNTDQYKNEFVGIDDWEPTKIQSGRGPGDPGMLNTKTGEKASLDAWRKEISQGDTERIENPEYVELQEEIQQLEQEMPGGEGFEDDFQGPKDVTELPGYKFRKEEGLDALASSGAAKGMQLSGQQMEEAQRFGQGLASQARGQLIDQLSMMAGMRPSQQPAQNLSSIGVQQGQSLSSLAQQQGQINAAGVGGVASGLGSGLKGLLSNNQYTSGGYAGNTGGGFAGGSVYGGGTGSSGAQLPIPSGGGL